MTQHREDRPTPNPEEIANIAANIRNESPVEPGQVPHSGGAHLPEDMRETPVHDFDNTTLSEAVEQGLVDTDVSSPADITHPEQATEEPASPATAVDSPEEVPGKSKRGRNIIIGSTAAAVLLGGLLYFANRGVDHSSEATDPNTGPTPTATTSGPSQPEQSATTQPENPGTNVLDPSIKPIEQVGQVDAATEITTLEDHVHYNSVHRLINTDAVNRLRQSTIPEVQQFMQKYVPETYPNYSMSEITASQDVMNAVYDKYIWQSQFYGKPQEGFKNPDTYKLLGSLPYATHKDIEDAYLNGDATELFSKMYNLQSSYSNNVLLGELKAGNTSNNLSQQLGEWELGNVVPTDSSEQTTSTEYWAQGFDQAIQQYKTNADQFEKSLPLTTPGSAKIVEANILSVSRQGWGDESTLDNQQELPHDEVTTMAVEIKTQSTQHVGQNGDATNQSDTLVVGALVPIPDGSSGNGEHLQFIVLGSGVNNYKS